MSKIKFGENTYVVEQSTVHIHSESMVILKAILCLKTGR